MFIASACNVTLIFHAEIPLDFFFNDFIFHLSFYLSSLFYSNVQPESTTRNSDSFSFGQVNTLPLSLTSYKEFLNFSFTKISNT